jgi:hypothetical protein
MCSCSRQDSSRRKAEQVQDKFIRVRGFNSESVEDSGGKIFEVHGHNDIHPAADGGSKDMAVTGIGELQTWKSGLLNPRYKGIQGVLVHQVSRALQLDSGQIRPIDEKIPHPLLVNFSGPLRPKQSGHGQMHQKIA